MCRLTSSGLIPIVVGAMNQLLETVAQSPCSLFIVLRHRTPSLSDMPFRSDRVSPSPYREYSSLSSGGESFLLVKEKAPSRSGFSASMYVVLKTRHVNPNIHVHRFIVHVRSPNLSATRPQLLSIRGAITDIGR